MSTKSVSTADRITATNHRAQLNFRQLLRESLVRFRFFLDRVSAKSEGTRHDRPSG